MVAVFGRNKKFHTSFTLAYIQAVRYNVGVESYCSCKVKYLNYYKTKNISFYK